MLRPTMVRAPRIYDYAYIVLFSLVTLFLLSSATTVARANIGSSADVSVREVAFAWAKFLLVLPHSWLIISLAQSDTPFLLPAFLAVFSYFLLALIYLLNLLKENAQSSMGKVQLLILAIPSLGAMMGELLSREARYKKALEPTPTHMKED